MVYGKNKTVGYILVAWMVFTLLGCGGQSDQRGKIAQEQQGEKINKIELSEEECQTSVLPSTVFIVTTNFLGYWTGSGIVLDSLGHILTNAHLVGAYAPIAVQNPVSKEFDPARLMGSSPGDDLAVIQVSRNLENYLPPHFGRSTDLSPDDRVYTIGYEAASDISVISPTFQRASVYKTGVRYDYYGLDDIIQLEASSRGNSGGPLINKYGEVAGINTLGFSDYEAYSYAIPIERAQKIVLFLLYGDIKNLGVGLVPNSESMANEHGNPYVKNSLVIISLEKGSPLYEAGWCRFDLLCQAEGIELRYPGDLCQLIRERESGTTITISGLGLYEDGVYRPYETALTVP